MNKNLLSITLLAALLAGCSDPEQEVQQFMQAAKNKPMPQIDPIPSFYEKRVATYEGFGGRTPFMAQDVYDRIRSYVPKPIKIDPHRKKQVLEQFPLELLQFNGVLSKGAKLDAMIQTPDGDMAIVRVGDYMGQNHGRIKSIGKESLIVVEAIEDGAGGHIESIKTLFPVLPDTSNRSKP